MGLCKFRFVHYVAFAAILIFASANLRAQGNVGTGSNAGAGVVVDAQGVLRMQRYQDPTGALMRQRQQNAYAGLKPELRKPSKLRKVSLNRLEKAVAEAAATGGNISHEMKYLAGMTRIEYVFFYPESNDIVIAGPAEGYVSDLSGRAVGITTGRAVLELEDLIVALRAFAPETKGTNYVGVSIDPTQEGLKRMQQFLSSFGSRATPGDTNTIIRNLREALGQQIVTVKGISPKTHFAQVLVEADYRMKLIGIGLERPTAEIPSYVANTSPGSVSRNAMQRWYFTPNYDCVKVSEDSLAMQLIGDGVKLVGENEMVTQAGGRVQSNTTSRASRLFTTAFTKKYGELSKYTPVYAQMRNLIDMLIVSAYIHEQDMYAQSDWDLGIFADEEGYPVENFVAPERVETAVNAVWKGRTLMTPIGGGVSIRPKEALSSDNITVEEDGKLAETHQGVSLDKLAPGQWWWD
ncbi:MAG: hypothetical protein COA78_03705 [Blastopirellula sp.]|nr:MAG: hypothetical protein COA78_03705 [Blastopirellula sp.]